MEEKGARHGILDDSRLIRPIEVLLIAVELHMEAHSQEKEEAESVRVLSNLRLDPNRDKYAIAKKLDYREGSIAQQTEDSSALEDPLTLNWVSLTVSDGHED